MRYKSYLNSFASRLSKGYIPRDVGNGKKPLTFEQYKEFYADARRDSFNTRFDEDLKKPATANNLLIEKSFGGKRDWDRASKQLESQKRITKNSYYKIKNPKTNTTYLEDLGLEGAALERVESILDEINLIDGITPQNYGYFSDLIAELAFYVDGLDNIFSPQEDTLRKYGLDFM